MTDGSVNKKRQITLKLKDGTRESINLPESFPEGAEVELYADEYYPAHKAVDF